MIFLLLRYHALRLRRRRDEWRHGLVRVLVFIDDGWVLEVVAVGKESAVVCFLRLNILRVHRLFLFVGRCVSYSCVVLSGNWV